MKKCLIAILVASVTASVAVGESVRVSTTEFSSVDKVGSVNRPGFLVKFELPAELQKARIDAAYLRFKTGGDSTERSLVLVVRPMLAPWASGLRLSALPESTASPLHVKIGRFNLKDGSGRVEVGGLLKVWQKAELPNLGFLVYPAEEAAADFQPRSLPTGGLAELEIFYTAPEVVKAVVEKK